MNEPLLAFDGVTYTYPGAREPALRDVSLAIEPGEFVVVAGASGGGKSSLLRAAGGLAPHFHGGDFGGRVTLAGLDTREHGPGDLAAHAGTLFQDPETQVVMGTPRGEIAFPLENRGETAGAVARGVEEAALALGIAPLLDRPVHELSGGELQRVALAAALAGRPGVVLLDEPASQLDPVAADELIWLLRRLNEEWGTAIVLAEHRLERCLPAADRVLVMDGGRLVADAPPTDFLAWAADAAPALLTPAARLWAAAGLAPAPVGVKAARADLRARGLGPAAPPDPAERPAPGRRRGRRRESALAFHRVWREHRDGPSALRGVSLTVAPGEVVALMGRNGAGKSTLLRVAAGLEPATRGRVRAAGRVALLLQNPGDYLVHETVAEEADAAALATEGLAALTDRHPRDLSGGERQRLALAVVIGPPSGEPPAALLLDEPTRGTGPVRRAELAGRLRSRAAEHGTAVVVATHDTELAAELGGRVILLGEGEIVADGPADEVLAGGWYFAPETARILSGAALLPEAGARVLVAAAAPEVALAP